MGERVFVGWQGCAAGADRKGATGWTACLPLGARPQLKALQIPRMLDVSCPDYKSTVEIC